MTAEQHRHRRFQQADRAAEELERSILNGQWGQAKNLFREVPLDFVPYVMVKLTQSTSGTDLAERFAILYAD